MGFELALLLGFAGLLAALAIIAIGFVTISFSCQARLLDNRPNTGDPILGAKDQAAIHDSPDLSIRMPNHLKTSDEMVDWMTKELPKLTAGMPTPRT